LDFGWGFGIDVQTFQLLPEAFGTINMNGYTNVFQGSLYFTGKAMSSK